MNPEIQACARDAGGNIQALTEADVGHLYDAFDEDRSGHIDFIEVVIGLSTLMDGTLEDRLGYAFAAFDTDGNNKICMDELSQMIKIINGWDHVRSTSLAQHIIATFDTVGGEGPAGGGDGQLDLDEFKMAG